MVIRLQKASGRRIHILSQYIWPDGAPTAIYADQLAQALCRKGLPTVLVGGEGTYREFHRGRPEVPISRVKHYRGARGRLMCSYFEYHSITRSFKRYIERHVRQHDLVVITSAPPNTVTLAPLLRRRQALSIYWLQDYYPEILRGLRDYPKAIRNTLSGYWDRCLGRWDHVIKIAANLGYSGKNSKVIRNWPTMTFGHLGLPEPKTALYTGNLGYCHDVARFVRKCEELADSGYVISVRGDGPGVLQLPKWVNVGPPFKSIEALMDGYMFAEIHLVAAHPDIQHALFPSKIWNSLASKRRIAFSGFEGAMADELVESLKAPFGQHLDQWCDFIEGLFHEDRPRYANAL